MDSYHLSPATLNDAVQLSVLESDSFPDDEAASLSTIQKRIEQAGAYFKILKCGNDSNNIVGFVNGTCTEHSVVHHNTMSDHYPQGKNLVIHSVTIDKSVRRKGLGQNMLQDYISIVAKESKHLEMMSLLSKAYLIPFYVSCGFSVVGLSSVSHGKEQWFELHLNLITYRSLEQIQVDAFALRPFSGNPAAVVFEHRDMEWMQNVAMENNYAETAFLSKVPYTDNEYNLRWFTPNKEVDLCGHATLAATHALYETKRVSDRLQRVTYHSLYSGTLSAVGKSDGTIELNFPATAPIVCELTESEYVTICTAFHINKQDILYTGRTSYDVFIELTPHSFANVSNVNYTLLEVFDARGVIITCLGGAHNSLFAEDSSNVVESVFDSETSTSFRSVPTTDGRHKVHADSITLDKKYDFLSRFFAPRFGVNEDPVTGSAHCALAPYWFEKLASHNKSLLRGYQASSRGGVVSVELKGDRVLLSGPAVTTMATRILV